jgi:charged multivesicular body protein 5
MYENQRDQLANQQFNVDQTSFAIETVQSTHQTVAAMKAASKTLKKESKKINLSEIEDMQDEMEGDLFFFLCFFFFGFFLTNHFRF